MEAAGSRRRGGDLPVSECWSQAQRDAEFGSRRRVIQPVPHPRLERQDCLHDHDEYDEYDDYSDANEVRSHPTIV